MVEHNIVYVLTNIVTGQVDMATRNDSEAWSYYRDMKDIRISVFISGNKIVSAEPTKTSI